MEPQTSQTSSLGSLDPQAVNLAKAIRQTESGGNFSAKGKSGEYGAYQFMPKTWEGASKESGVNVSLDQATPEQQNQVAYTRIKKWKDEGYNPGEIASMWNSGDRHAYLGSFSDGSPAEGTNHAGVQFNVPKYAEEVAKNYHSLNGPSQSPQNSQLHQNNSSGDILSVLGGLGAGALGWLVGSATGIAKAGLPLAGAAIGGMATKSPMGAVAGGEIGSNLANLIPGGEQPRTDGASSPPQPQGQIPIQPLGQSVDQSLNTSNAVKNAITEALGTTQSNRVFSQTPAGQGAIGTAASYGLLAPDENGIMNFDEKRREQLLGKLAEAEKKFVTAEGGQGSMLSVLEGASDYIGKNRMLAPDKRENIKDLVTQYAKSYANLNETMDLGKMVEARHQQYAATKGKYGTISSDEIEARKALAHGFRQAILKNTPNQALYERVLKEEENLIRTKELGKRLHGKRAPKTKGAWESLLRQGARAAEIYIGHRLGGPIGAIIGGIAGEHFNNKLDQRFGRNVFETPGMRAALDILHDTKPEVYGKLLEALKQRGTEIHPKEIGSKKSVTAEGLVKKFEDREPSIEEMDALVNEIKAEKKGLVSLPKNKKKTINRNH